MSNNEFHFTNNSTRPHVKRNALQVRKIKALGGKSFELDVHGNMTIAELKKECVKKMGIRGQMYEEEIELEDDAAIKAEKMYRLTERMKLVVVETFIEHPTVDITDLVAYINKGEYFADDTMLAEIDNNATIEIGHPGNMILFVKTLVGNTICVMAYPEITVEQFKRRVQDIDGTHPDEQRMVFAARQVDDGRTLADYKIQNESTIHLVCYYYIFLTFLQFSRLRGGMYHYTSGRSDLYFSNEVVITLPNGHPTRIKLAYNDNAATIREKAMRELLLQQKRGNARHSKGMKSNIFLNKYKASWLMTPEP
jgi:large subunit ribosomal protein L40e